MRGYAVRLMTMPTPELDSVPLLRAAPSTADDSPLDPPCSAVLHGLSAFIALTLVSFTVGVASVRVEALAAVGPALEVGRLGAFGGCVALWGRWQLRAARNARRLTRERVSYSPWGSVATFVVPVLNVIRPLWAVTEIWNASFGRPLSSRAPGLLVVWWALWLAPFALRLGAARGGMSPSMQTLLVGLATVGTLGAALAARLVVGRINEAQRRRIRARIDAPRSGRPESVTGSNGGGRLPSGA